MGFRSKKQVFSALFLWATSLHAQPVLLTPQQISISSSSVAANAGSVNCSLSNDGKLVAFESYATNLVSGANSGIGQSYLRDRKVNTTRLLSRASGVGGVIGNSDSGRPVISSQGNIAIFESLATNLVAADTNGTFDIFARDLATEALTRLSVSSSGAQANAESNAPAISADGRYVVFISQASNLVASDLNSFADIFLRDRQSSTTTRISKGLSTEANENSWIGPPAISMTGRYVVFSSLASNLVANDTNARADVFLYDISTGSTELISIPPAAQSFSSAVVPMSVGPGSVSSDGRYVTFGIDTSSDGFPDNLYLRDRTTSTTTLISKNSAGQAANASSEKPVLSSTGERVAFYSLASNLLSTAPNGGVFFSILAANTLSLIDDANGYNPCISADGSVVGYQHWDTTVSFERLFVRELDDCPSDPNKLLPGACGCGVADTDANNNLIPDCKETVRPAAPRNLRLL